MELFTQDWSLSQKLRMPAISRLQKVHNVDIALNVLKAKGVDLKDNGTFRAAAFYSTWICADGKVLKHLKQLSGVSFGFSSRCCH